MKYFRNQEGRQVLLAMVKEIQDNKAYLGEVDGLIGDGDHGANMNKGFSLFASGLGEQGIYLSEGLSELGMVLFNEIGGSMGPIYGTVFMDMGDAIDGLEKITLEDFTWMFKSGLAGLKEIVEAEPGDKTLIDTLSPAVCSLQKAVKEGLSFDEALRSMLEAAENGKNATKEMRAKFGRSSRLGERSRGVLDAGAVSCFLILKAMAKEIGKNLREGE